MSEATEARERYRNAIEEATGCGLNVNDPLPDVLAALADEFGIAPWRVVMWIHDKPEEWTGRNLLAWLRWSSVSGGEL